MAKKKILGLDLGTSSIGWAFIELDESSEQGSILGIGSRIFEPPVEPKSGEPKNLKRRKSRGMRRMLARRAMRRDTLVRRLIKAGLLPPEAKNAVTRANLFNHENPYRLRAIGLDAKLSLHQLGRGLFHMNERRGFLSNRKSSKKKKDEDGKILTEISALEKAIADSGTHTLGEYLYRLMRGAQKKRETALLRCRHTSRKMYEVEFEALWTKQAAYHPELTDELKKSVRQAIFFQRPLKVQKGLVGPCSFYQWKQKAKNEKGKEVEFAAGKKRCQRSHPLYQRFRMLQDVNGIRIKNEPLTQEERAKLIAKLESQQKLEWKQVRKLFKLEDFDVINLERESKKLIGLQTIQRMEDTIGASEWAKLTSAARDGIYEAITTIEDEDVNPARITGLLMKKFNLPHETALALAKLPLEEGYAPLSLKAIKVLLPHLESGHVYMKALQKAVDEFEAMENSLKSLDRAFLANARRMVGRPQPGMENRPKKLGPAPIIRNPVVQRALHETRRVVNAICAKWGAPDEIKVELARDLKLNAKRKEELGKEQSKAGKERDEARKFYEENGRTPSGDDILKYRLRKECGGRCPYTGKNISEGLLLGTTGEVHIEHIIPFSRCWDDGFNNKTLCFADENRTKNNLTPWEAYGKNEQRWGEIMQNIKHLPNSKKNRFLMKELPTDLPERYLNDTRYMSREARDYLHQICPKVHATKGGLTAKLRYFWGLNGILREGEENPQNKKNREDHRHHAIDAAVIALTTHGALNRLSRANAVDGHVRPADFPSPWRNFRDDVAAKVKTMIVSHRPSRKISGALHEETRYGSTETEGIFVTRKKIESLSAGMVENILDKHIKDAVKKAIDRYGDAEEAAKAGIIIPSGIGKAIPVKKVRVRDKMSEGSYHKFKEGAAAPYGSNHHVEIFESPDGKKWEGRFVTTMEAARRARIAKTAIIDRTPDADKTGWKFIMSLSRGEMLRLSGPVREGIYRIKELWAPNGQIVVIKHLSGAENKEVMFAPNSNSLKQKYKAEKIAVSVLGEAKSAHD